MSNKNSLPSQIHEAREGDPDVQMQQYELQRGQAVVLHEMPDQVRDQVPVLPIQARKLMGLVRAGSGQFAIFGESSSIANADRLMRSDVDSPLQEFRMRKNPVVYYIDPQAGQYFEAGRISDTQDGRITVGRSTITEAASRRGMNIDANMSREHFTVTMYQDGNLSLEDHSRNGTGVVTGVEQTAEYEHSQPMHHDLGHTAVMPEAHLY